LFKCQRNVINIQYNYFTLKPDVFCKDSKGLPAPGGVLARWAAAQSSKLTMKTKLVQYSDKTWLSTLSLPETQKVWSAAAIPMSRRGEKEEGGRNI